MEDPTKKEEIMDNKNEKDSKPALPTRSYVVMAGRCVCSLSWLFPV